MIHTFKVQVIPDQVEDDGNKHEEGKRDHRGQKFVVVGFAVASDQETLRVAEQRHAGSGDSEHGPPKGMRDGGPQGERIPRTVQSV